MTQRIDDKLPV